jgi:putative membrane protein
MVFVDDLAYGLFSISFAGFLLLYTILSVYLAYKRNERDFSSYLKSASVPLGIIGLYMLVMGLWGQFSWPLPGSYNILFYDPFISFGILLIAFAIAVKYGTRLEYVGFLGLLAGGMAIIYGAEGYSLGLTASPIALLLMYMFYGLAGIFSYPVALLTDRLAVTQKRMRRQWHVIFIIFFILLFLASSVAGVVGLLAVPAHLKSAP